MLWQGLIKRVGDRTTTNIWTDAWPPMQNLKQPVALLPNPPKMVAELIIPTSATWNEPLIWSTFIPLDVEEILKIPLCTKKVADF